MESLAENNEFQWNNDNNLWSDKDLRLSYRYKSPASCVFVSCGCCVVASCDLSPSSEIRIMIDIVCTLHHILRMEASLAQWLCSWPCKMRVASSILGFSSLLDETINRGPVSI